MVKVKINGTHSITTTPSSTLLETLEAAGMDVEYNCRDGHCGACRCQLASGEVEYVGFAMAYTQANEILPCITRAKTDVELENLSFRLNDKRA